MVHLQSFMLVTLSVLLMASVSFESPSKKRETDDSVICQNNVMHQIDHYIKQIQLVPNGKHRFPETIAKLKEACKINNNLVSMVTTLANKCMTGFKKNVMQVTLYSVKKQQKALCRAKPTKEMHDLVAAGKCVNGGQALFRKCIQTAANNILKVKVIDDNQKIPLICCEIVRTKQCLMKESKKVKECKEEHIDTIQNRYNHVSMNGINLACGDYNEETDRCNKVRPPKVTVERPNNKSIVITMFELLDSLPLDDDVLPRSS